jgi:L-ascorbate metabolism protein UlaG (beta-lactamase superfamily)
MEITWYGLSCFRITERGMSTIVTDPYDPVKTGLDEIKLKADIVTISHDAPSHSNLKAVKEQKWVITGPGEYEIGGVFLNALRVGDREKNGNNIVCVYDYEGLTVAHLGDIQDVPKRKELESMGSVDILLVPVGGGKGLAAGKAAEVVNLIEPKIVIPMHFKTDDLKLELTGLDAFLKQMGSGKELEVLDSLKIKSKDLPEDTTLVVLNHKR